MKISVIAYAKINLFLEIIKKRSDSYHDIDTVMQSIDLYDTITVHRNENSDRIYLTGDIKYTKKFEDNLAYKAAVIFFSYTNIKSLGIEINIKKRIPISAGLAGGSADAAATLIALDRLLGTGLSNDELCYLGKQIGADVPFCLLGGTFKASNIGDKLVKLDNLPLCFFVVIKPDLVVSTKEAYALYDKYNGQISIRQSISIINAICNKDIHDISDNLFNRFEYITQLDLIQNIKTKLSELGAINSCMSGSGPTVYGIFDKESTAKNCADNLSNIYKNLYVCKPCQTGFKFI
jgi:4-diphosphocytidyl-2-C-methyl-D-erythritol kinase